MKLPHPLRPGVLPATDVPTGPEVAWFVPLVILLAMVAVGWWWLRRQRPQRRRSAGPAGASPWDDLATAVGSANWYERFGERICTLQGYRSSGHHDTARLLAALFLDEAGPAWRPVARRWEWAIYAGHPGTAREHEADLQLARARWP
jgi:hypothetical protein